MRQGTLQTCRGQACGDPTATSALHNSFFAVSLQYKFIARPLGCPTCPIVTAESRTGNSTLTPLAFSAQVGQERLRPGVSTSGLQDFRLQAWLLPNAAT